jgi:hypothetical protein
MTDSVEAIRRDALMASRALTKLVFSAFLAQLHSVAVVPICDGTSLLAVPVMESSLSTNFGRSSAACLSDSLQRPPIMLFWRRRPRRRRASVEQVF